MEPDMTRRSYALWLVPSGDLRRRLARTIRRLSRAYATPSFPPHVTLASRIAGPRQEVLAKAAQLAREIPPLTLRLTGIEGRNEYFRCLVARVGPNKALRQAHRLAKRIFGLRAQRPFMPHLSLVYGDLAPSTKRKIIASLGKRFDVEFEVRHMDVVAIQGPPRQWRRVQSIHLTPPGRGGH